MKDFKDMTLKEKEEILEQIGIFLSKKKRTAMTLSIFSVNHLMQYQRVGLIL